MQPISRIYKGRNLLNKWYKKHSTIAQPAKLDEKSTFHENKQGSVFTKIKDIKQKHFAPCIVQNYRTPLFLKEGNMQWLFDQNGKRYLDMFGGIATVSCGHCHPKINEALRSQLEEIWHCPSIYLHPKVYEYAEKLVSKFPGNLKVAYFLNSGTEANEIAVMLARAYTKNYEIISFRNAYHGHSPFAMSISGVPIYRHNVPSANGVIHATCPDVYKGIWGGKYCRDSPVQTTRNCDCNGFTCQAADNYYTLFEDIFNHSLAPGHVAGMIVEPIQGVGGTVQYPKGILKKCFDIVKKNGGVFIADEVQTGFGRTGETYWGFEAHGIIPDIVTLAKGIGNGFPLAAVVTTPEIASVLKQALHFTTYGGNPLSAAVGISVMEVIEEEKLQENTETIGTHLLLELGKLRDEFECIGDVRGKGLMIGVELVGDRKTKTPLPKEQFLDIWDDCKEMGVIIGRGGVNVNVFRIKPPMCITKENADFTVDVLRKAFKKHQDKCKP